MNFAFMHKTFDVRSMNDHVTALVGSLNSAAVSSVTTQELVAPSQQRSNGDDGETEVDEEGTVEANDDTVDERETNKKAPGFNAKSFITSPIDENGNR